MRKIACFVLVSRLCAASASSAQEYGPYRPYGVYEDPMRRRLRTVIVHPDYDYIDKRTLAGRVGGEVNHAIHHRGR
jgi:hypothetical protein